MMRSRQKALVDKSNTQRKTGQLWLTLVLVGALILCGFAAARWLVTAETVRLFVNPNFVPSTSVALQGRILDASAYELEPSYIRLRILANSGESPVVIINSHTTGNLDESVNLLSLRNRDCTVQAKAKPFFFQGERNEYYALNVLTK